MRTTCYDVIRAIATLLILSWHFYTTCNEQSIPISHIFSLMNERGLINTGGVGVGLFFLLSGALLYKNYADNFSIKQFYKKRLLRLYIPLWVSYIFAFGLTFVINPDIVSSPLLSIIIPLLGCDYFAEEWFKYLGITTLSIVGEWFTTVIILLYILFPLLRRMFIHHRKLGTCIVTILFFINMKVKFLSYWDGWFSITNGLMYFWIGMLIVQYKNCIEKIGIWRILVLLIVLYIVNPSHILGFWYLPCFLFSVLLFMILTNCKNSCRFFDYLSQNNFEIYLIHHRLCIILLPLFLNQASNQLQILLTILFTLAIILVFSEKLHNLNQRINDRIKNVTISKNR